MGDAYYSSVSSYFKANCMFLVFHGGVPTKLSMSVSSLAVQSEDTEREVLQAAVLQTWAVLLTQGRFTPV